MFDTILFEDFVDKNTRKLSSNRRRLVLVERHDDEQNKHNASVPQYVLFQLQGAHQLNTIFLSDLSGIKIAERPTRAQLKLGWPLMY